LRNGPTAFSARAALELATRGSAACLGRQGEIGQLTAGACGDLVVWRLSGITFAGALTDPVDALLRCGPVSAHHTVVAGRFLVEGGELISPSDDVLARHRAAAVRLQGLDR
jgi:cytosine/adenosine deaminase-related metal-dependent hydrolase